MSENKNTYRNAFDFRKNLEARLQREAKETGIDLHRVLHLLLHLYFFAAIPGYAWEYDQNVTIEGVLRQAERMHITWNSEGKENTRIEKSIVLVTDEPIILSHSIAIGKQKLVEANTSYSYIKVYLDEEFSSLIGKRVQCSGHFQRSCDPITDEIILGIDTALDCDCEQPTHQSKTIFYEPEEVELSGMLYKVVYPGLPNIQVSRWAIDLKKSSL